MFGNTENTLQQSAAVGLFEIIFAAEVDTSTHQSLVWFS